MALSGSWVGGRGRIWTRAFSAAVWPISDARLLWFAARQTDFAGQSWPYARQARRLKSTLSTSGSRAASRIETPMASARFHVLSRESRSARTVDLYAPPLAGK